MPRLTEQERLDLLEQRDASRGMRQLERRVGDRRDARKAPRLLLHVGEAQIAEASDSAFAQILEPGGNAGGSVRSPRVIGAD